MSTYVHAAERFIQIYINLNDSKKKSPNNQIDISDDYIPKMYNPKSA
ncbi:hypothetical protein EMIT036CA2_20393 [Chryseobacterium sp. IT-36CA2]